ncbi:hypothetical protein D4A92_01120 [Rhizobium rosettiformans]|uniref:Uncharacterized protein n=1 Tax=Rhizobium rosettiformans TaxID=1368430 RepID=A0ABX7EPA3_9HYPH|nr:hypothetical protein [Rhizobium rosettiformans]QRF50145.1 hypothetical protein D4A92_01120 [Rhizobium rosettiformans]
MADKNVVHLGENSPEEVAFKLFATIAAVEQKSVSASDPDNLKAGWTKADRTWILQTYAECIDTVRTAYYSKK